MPVSVHGNPRPKDPEASTGAKFRLESRNAPCIITRAYGTRFDVVAAGRECVALTCTWRPDQRVLSSLPKRQRIGAVDDYYYYFYYYSLLRWARGGARRDAVGERARAARHSTRDRFALFLG